MDPTMNDVLSGRGAWFNQHPGNKHFRRMLEEQKAVYMAGTKKQKMDISKAIVEAIYLKTPPGRFLKKCPDTGQWSELSKRDAADRAAQAMAYTIKGESLKEKRRQRRSSRKMSKDEVDDDVGRKSSQSSHRSTHNQQHATTRYLEGNHSSSSVAHHGPDTRRGGAVGTSNDMPSASDLLHVLGNSNLQQQLLLQRLQQPSTTLPTSSVSYVDHNLDQHGLGQLLAQAMQQQQQQLQQQQLQQLPLQYTMGQNPLGQLLHSQTSLQPALLEGLTHQLLNQAQQQQQQLTQHQLLFQRLLNQQIVLPPASLTPTISLTAPFLTGHLSQPANNTLLQNMQRQSNTPSNALLLSSVLSSLHHQPNSSAGISNPPQGAQQADQLQHSLMLQQNQLLATSLGASSNSQLAFQHQQLQPLDPLLQQTLQATLQLQQNLQGLPPPAPINNSTGMGSANVAAQTSRREESEDEVHSGPDDDDSCGD